MDRLPALEHPLNGLDEHLVADRLFQVLVALVVMDGLVAVLAALVDGGQNRDRHAAAVLGVA